MATYYKYAERNAESQINWAEVGKNITDMLREEDNVREKKKAAIDEASRQFGLKIASAPTGEHTGLATWTLNYANDAQQARLLQDRLLKSGQLKLKDYLIMRQNLNDGTDQVFNLSKEYQGVYKDKMERMKKGDSQNLEWYLTGSVEPYANFNESKILINPTDYTINVGKMKKNEQGGYDLTDEVATVNDLRNRIQGKFDKFNTRQANEQIAGGLATYVTDEIKRGSTTRAGQIISVEDAMKRPGYQKALDDAIESNLQVPYNISSILTEDIGFDRKTGKEYSFTFNEEEAKKNPNLILLRKDPTSGMMTPEFTTDQKAAAKDFMKGQIEQMIKYKEETTVFNEPRADAATLAYSKDARDAQDFGTMLSYLYSGTPEQVQTAQTYFNGLPNVRGVDRTRTGIIVRYNDGSEKPIPFYTPDNRQIGLDNFVRSGVSQLGGKGNVENYVQGASRTKNRNLNTQTEILSQTYVPTPPSPIETLQQLGVTTPNYQNK